MKQLVLSLFFLFPSIIWACTCYCDLPNLCEALSSEKKFAVIHVKVLSYSNDYSWKVLVQKDFRGTVSEDTVLINLISTCTEPLLNNDSEWAQAGDEQVVVCEELGIDDVTGLPVYIQESCNFVQLKYTGGKVFGATNGKRDTFSYSEFEVFVQEDYATDRYCISCDCYCYFLEICPHPDSTFCYTRNLALDKDSNLIIARAEIIRIQDNLVELNIEELLSGSESQKSIKAWCQYGLECRAISSEFTVGDDYVMILYPLDTFDLIGPAEVIGDYEIASCGEHFLKIEDEVIYGSIANKIRTITYSDLKNQILTNFKDIEYCNDWIVNNNDPAIHEIEVFPNPATDKVYINLNAANPVDVLFYDIHGQVLMSQHFSNQSSIHIDLLDLDVTSATLLVEIRQKERSVIKKLLVR